MKFHHYMRRVAASLVIAGFLMPCLLPEAEGVGILDTKHNLSKYGPGEIKAKDEVRVCIFCHTPHHASSVTPLWSRPEDFTVYNLYSSSTTIAKRGQPSGASRLCLSCHDGTIALGALYGSDPNVNTIEMAGGITKLPAYRTTNLGGPSGTDLTNDHPISFLYTTELAQKNGQLKIPVEVSQLSPQIRLEQGAYLQCTSCHNPHRNPYGKFLVMDNTGSKLCTSCHEKSGWVTSGHATNGVMSVSGCGNCHPAHNAQIPQRLLKNAPAEQNCLTCHRPFGSGKNIESQLSKFYAHPIYQTSGIHDEAENPLTAQKHVACEDCHNPHQGNSTPAVPPYVNGSLLGVKGIGSTDDAVLQSTFEYEICFRCHGDNNFDSKQPHMNPSPPPVARQVQEFNTRLEFSTDNPSYHPVVGQGKGTNVPSLRPGYTTNSMIYCTDCHGSDDSVKGGGAEPNGPHGSKWPYLLIAQYETDIYSLQNPPAYQESNFTLCWRCHDQNFLFAPTTSIPHSPFPQHSSHVKDRGILCSVCHDPHGVSSQSGGTSTANAHLINFDTRYVTSGTGYNSTTSTCDLNCHTSVHPPYK